MSVIFSQVKMPILLFDKKYGGSAGDVKGQINFSARLFLRYRGQLISDVTRHRCAQMVPSLLGQGQQAVMQIMGQQGFLPFLKHISKVAVIM